jgi:TatD DNase family protein
MWFDSHCHLHICEEEIAADLVVEQALGAGVTRMLTIGIDRASSERSVELADGEKVFAAVGVHPGSSTGWTAEMMEPIESLAGCPEVVAIGETGLDFYRDYSPRDDQENAFIAHIELAKRTDKALVIHTRESLDAALEILEEHGPPARFVFHCWSGDQKQLERALPLGAYVSFAGNVSFGSAGDLRAIVPLVPEDRLLIETDSPYLTPVPHRGKPNRPAHVVHVGAAIATTLSTTSDAIARRTSENASKFLALQ